jgi:predicted dehydrogenase
MVGHHHRHSPAIQRAKRAIEEGLLGRVVAASGLTWFLKPASYFETSWRRQPGGGPILINLVHVVDDLRNLLGEIVQVQAARSSAVRGFAVEDTAAVLITFRSGALATFALSDTAVSPWSWETTSGENAAYPRTDQACYQIAGTEGALSLPALELWRHGGERSWMAPLERTRLAFQPADPLTMQMRHFCKVVRGEAQPLCSGREGALTLAATLAIAEAARSGGTVRLG